MGRRKIAILVVAGVLIILGLLYWFNPTETSLAPKCIVKSLTGWSCPGCGMQRFLHAMLHGRFLEAIRYNYLLIILIPYIILFGIQELILKGDTQKKWRKVLEGRPVTYTLCVIAPAWFIIRNILGI